MNNKELWVLSRLQFHELTPVAIFTTRQKLIDYVEKAKNEETGVSIDCVKVEVDPEKALEELEQIEWLEI